MLPVLRVASSSRAALCKTPKARVVLSTRCRRTRRQRVRCSAEGNAAITATRASNERATGPKGALTGAALGAASSRLTRRALTDAAGHARSARSLEAKRRAAMRQVRRPPQAVPRARPPSYRRYAMALGAAATGFMALLVIYGSVSLREGVVGVQDSAPGASSYENAQSKELSKTELKETDDEVACCPYLAASVYINRCLRLIRRLPMASAKATPSTFL